jgi:mRNA-degrading endonuclease RelE of RelBE toxin-antitoxin system
MSEPRMVQVQFSVPFLRRLKDLTKRYRKIRQDIQPVIDALAACRREGLLAH